MSRAHHHHHETGPARRAEAAAPTLSLLRLSAGQRLAGVGVAIVLLWAAILSVIGWI
ncbi:hypothetical protein [Salinarimonas ramus]|uniref:Uncharacterized protein n=1 Tax=Salinarimonas ramus TaxID=690164 RepID=A0A917V9S6_9HYPH|nr:hypothetical protein [Salinarimonas ramus]GGK53828.1 hypothetical protein GCM10011322_45790 [Salinarimonas ramus]